MAQKVLGFVRSESGAVSVEYLPVIAMTIGLGILAGTQLQLGADRPDESSAKALSEIDFVELTLGDTREVTEDMGPAERVRRNNGGARSGNGEDHFVPRSAGCASVETSCSGLGDDTNPGASSDSNNAAGTPGGDGTDNPNQAN